MGFDNAKWRIHIQQLRKKPPILGYWCTIIMTVLHFKQKDGRSQWLFILFFVQICIRDSGCSVYRRKGIMPILVTIGPMAETMVWHDLNMNDKEKTINSHLKSVSSKRLSNHGSLVLPNWPILTSFLFRVYGVHLLKDTSHIWGKYSKNSNFWIFWSMTLLIFHFIKIWQILF